MTSNQMIKLRERIAHQKQSSRNALARILREKRKYKNRPAFDKIISYYDGCETELKISISNMDYLLDLIQSMEEFNAYS